MENKTKNRLNDLNGREWLPLTRSAYVDGVTHPSQELDWDKVLRELQGSIVVMSKATPRDSPKKTTSSDILRRRRSSSH